MSARFHGLTSLTIACVTGAVSAFAQPALATAADAGWQWINVGPSVIAGPYGEASGRVSSLAVSPDGTLFAASANGGVWRRSASIWQPLTDAKPNLAFGAIAIASSDPTILYAATGEASDCGDCAAGSGVMRGTNSGANWTDPSLVVTGATDAVNEQQAHDRCAPLDAARGAAIVIDPHDADHVVVGNTAGVFSSADGGKTWQRTWCLPVSDIKSLDGNGIATLLMGDTFGLHKSINSGSTWTDVPIAQNQLPVQLNVDNYYSIALAVAPGHPDTVYASIAHANYGGGLGCLAGLLVSSKAGDLDFKRIDVPDYFSSLVAYGRGPDCQGTYDNTIAVDPLNPGRIYVGGIALLSVDTSVTPTRVVNLLDPATVPYPQLHPDQHALLFANGSLYIGNDGGVSELQSDGKLVNRNDGLRITQFSRGGSQRGDGDDVVAGTQDNGTIDIFGLRTKHPENDADARWCAIAGGDGGMTAIVPGAHGLYVESQRGTIQRLRVDRPPCLIAGSPPPNPDPNWSDVAPPFAVTPEKAPWITPFAILRGDPHTMIAGGDDVYQALDVPGDAKAWSALSKIFWTSYAPAPNRSLLVSTVTLGDDAGRIIYSGHFTNGVLQSTFDGDAASPKWRLEDPIGKVRSPAADDGSRGDVTDILVAPDSPYHIYVTIKDGGAGYMIETPDAHANPVQFSNVSQAGLRSGVNRLLQLKGDLIAATDDGVFRRDGPSWTSLGVLPAVPVVDLVPTESGCLFALTHGRGAWFACPPHNGTP